MRDLEEFGESGDPEARKRLAESLSKALEGLSEEERKRLAEKLQKQLEQNGGKAQPLSKEQLEELARRLATPEGQEELKKQLEELGKDQSGKDAEREQGLDDADRGGAQCQRGLGAVPVPSDSPGAPGNGKGKQAGNDKGNGNGKNGGAGSKRDEGQGDHGGKTDRVEAPSYGPRPKARSILEPPSRARRLDARLDAPASPRTRRVRARSAKWARLKSAVWSVRRFPRNTGSKSAVTSNPVIDAAFSVLGSTLIGV